ncbi:MAG: DUF1553 domain-containing protein [Pirellulales bacterium]
MTSFRRMFTRRLIIALSTTVLLIGSMLGASTCLRAAPPVASTAGEKIEFFESHIRPLLIEYCYECHNAQRKEGGLALDSRPGWQAGGDSGPVVDISTPSNSLLMKAVQHASDELKMPEGGAKLSDRAIADLRKWIESGATDPRDTPLTAEQAAADKLRDLIFDQRKHWWAVQPLGKFTPPTLLDQESPRNPIDAFLRAALAQQKLQPNPEATPEVLLRRASYALTGLPPTDEELNKVLAADSAFDFEELVDRLIDSPQFGERFARHWMDWIRYTDSHGSEGDPAIPYAYQYRDYLIRALNADVPYTQLVREHIAGDLIKNPRINSELQINESAIGPAHLRMVFHGFAPTDALEEKVRFVDDQINSVSKAFLGLTVSCARCHDHKFDAIRQSDYYALFGIFASCHPGIVDAGDLPGFRNNLGQMRDAKRVLQAHMMQVWFPAVSPEWDDPSLGSFAKLADRAAKASDSPVVSEFWNAASKDLRDKSLDGKLSDASKTMLAKLRQQATELVKENESDAERRKSSNETVRTAEDLKGWFRTGLGCKESSLERLNFEVGDDADHFIPRVYPASITSNILSRKHQGIVVSPRFLLDAEYDLWVLAAGDRDAQLRYAVQDYPRNGTVYPVINLNGGKYQWFKFDVGYWKGDTIHVELTTASDAPVLAKDQPESWFSLREVRLLKKGSPAPVARDIEPLVPLLQRPLLAMDLNWLVVFTEAKLQFHDAIHRFQSERLSDAEVLYINHVKSLVGHPGENLKDKTEQLIKQFQLATRNVRTPFRVPGVIEADGYDQPLLVRGDHRHPEQPVPRHFLGVFDAKPYEPGKSSGRLQLAESLAGTDNPLVARVIVNRLWHHLFGKGLVITPDNFGKLGDSPAHPELLDYLANQMIEKGWSIKKMIRLMVTSAAWRQSSRPSQAANTVDPDNRYWSHAEVNRLDAEAIRDSFMARAGNLDRTLYGPAVGQTSARRSLYLRVDRNNLNPLLRTFDFPEPAATVGKRDVTNVPAQALMLMNDPLIIQTAESWATKTSSITARKQRIATMIRTAFCRAERPEEVERVIQFQDQLTEEYQRRELLSNRLSEQIKELRSKQDLLFNAARDELNKKLSKQPGNKYDLKRFQLPTPIAAWEFDDLKDSTGGQTGTLVGQAVLEQGGLKLNGGYFLSAPLTKTLTEKTLEAWVQLDDLKQRGGGVLSVQDRAGAVFDAIVFAEQEPRRWLAGSNVFARTQALGGDEEKVTGETIYLAMVYSADGTITAYRNGVPYGKPYKSQGPVAFQAEESVVTIGLRHLPAGGNRFLTGRIERARVFSEALTAEQILAGYEGAPFAPSKRQILEQLSEPERQQVAALSASIDALEQQREELSSVPADKRETTVWRETARALFASQEFIFIK